MTRELFEVVEVLILIVALAIPVVWITVWACWGQR